MSRLLYDVCSECGKSIFYGESYYCINKHREIARRVKGADEIEVKKAELLMTYCTECAKTKDFSDMFIARKQKTFTEKLDKIVFSKSPPLAIVYSLTAENDSFGTGVFIGREGYLLTARHVVEDFLDENKNANDNIDRKIGSGELKKKDRLRERKRSEKEILDHWNILISPLIFGKAGGRLLETWTNESMCDGESDMAVLKLKKSKKVFPSFKVNTEYIPTLNEEIYGIALGLKNITIFTNKVIAIRKYKREGGGIVIGCQTDYSPYAGNSGGAILNRYGELIGIMTSSRLSAIMIGDKRATGLAVHEDRGNFYSLSTCSIDLKKYL